RSRSRAGQRLSTRRADSSNPPTLPAGEVRHLWLTNLCTIRTASRGNYNTRAQRHHAPRPAAALREEPLRDQQALPRLRTAGEGEPHHRSDLLHTSRKAIVVDRHAEDGGAEARLLRLFGIFDEFRDLARPAFIQHAARLKDHQPTAAHRRGRGLQALALVR